MFSKFLTQSVHLGGIRGHKPPENGVLQHFQQVLSLNIGDTELDLGRQFSLDFLETWQDGCFFRGLKLYSFWTNSPNEGGARGHANSRIFRK